MAKEGIKFMRFSVYIPMYNAERYLGKAIESVLNQTFSDFELLIVDDGSIDGSLALARSYSSKDSRVRIICKENTGVYKTRITAFENMEGEYAVALDSDDMLHPKALELMDSLLKDSGQPDALFHELVRFSDKQASTVFDNLGNEDAVIIEEFEGPTLISLYEKLVLSEEYNSMCKKTVKVDLLKKSLGEMWAVDEIEMGDDCVLSLKAFSNAKSFYVSNLRVYAYRYNKTSLTNRIRKRALQSWLVLFQERDKFVRQLGLADVAEKLPRYKQICLAKLIAYNPYDIRGKDDRKCYNKMLTSILSTPYTADLLVSISDLPILYKFPLALLRKRYFNLLCYIKRASARIRLLLVR